MRENVDWARRLARGRSRRYPGMDPGDAEGAALLALLGCARRWRPGGAPFRAWATRRIFGALLDAHRDADPVSRDERIALKEGRETALARRGLPHRVSVDVGDLERGDEARAAVPAGQQEVLEAAAARAALAEAVRSLPGKLGHVIAERFLKGRTLNEIGRDLGVSESRVCQIERSGLLELRLRFPALAEHLA